MYDVVIIGGGLAGLTNAILLGRQKLKVALVEKRNYPFHRVCGEYISNEVLPFLERHDLYPSELSPTRIEQLQVTSTSGRTFSAPLDLGGFGISRYAYDAWLADRAREAGVSLLTGTSVQEVRFMEDHFVLQTTADTLQARLVIATHGKRSRLDQTLQRSFLQKRSPYVGVKYHMRTTLPGDAIALHNFPGGYCGVDQVEGGVTNVCYLIHRDQVRKHGSIEQAEQRELFRNPHIRGLFHQGESLFEKPLVINEITFEAKEPVLDHLLMAGDAAGMITPLCGNGMAMAIHSAHILTGVVMNHWHGGVPDRNALEREYSKQWKQQFSRRLWTGRKLQTLFGSGLSSELAVLTGRYLRAVTRQLIRLSHGRPFV